MQHQMIRSDCSECGANAVEYGLVMAIIAALALGAASFMRSPIEQFFTQSAECVLSLVNGAGCESFRNTDNPGTQLSLDQTSITHQIDFDFISQLEGGMRLDGYYPCDPNTTGCGSSGVTISVGFDLGVRNLADLHSLGLPQDLIDKLSPYLGKTGQEAVDFLRDNPITITEEEAQLLYTGVKRQATERLIERYNADSGIDFSDIPPEWQTVIASVEYQYGSLQARTPRFWGYVTSQDWDNAIAELRNFGDAYPTRRNREADYVESH